LLAEATSVGHLDHNLLEFTSFSLGIELLGQPCDIILTCKSSVFIKMAGKCIIKLPLVELAFEHIANLIQIDHIGLEFEQLVNI
jgi:hypothetical protein